LRPPAALAAEGRRVTSNTAVQVVGRIAGLVLGVLTSAILARYLGPEGYGAYAFVFAYLGFFAPIIWLGIDPIVVRILAAEERSGEGILGSALGLKLVLAVGTALVAAAIVPLVVEPELRWLTVLAAPLLVASALGSPGLIFTANLRMEFRTLADVGAGGLLLVAVTGVTFASLGLGAVIAGHMLSALAGAGLVTLFARRFVRVRPRADLGAWAALIRQGFPLGVAGLFHQLYYRADIVLLTQLKGIEVVGPYSIAYGLFDQGVVLFSFLAGSLFPVMVRARARGSDLGRMIQFGFVAALVTAAAGVGCAWLLGGVVIEALYGPAFLAALPSLAYLTMAYPFVFSSYVLSHALVTLGRHSPLWAVNGVALLVNVALNFALIGPLGAEGSALATVATEGVVVGASAVLFARTRHEQSRLAEPSGA
jgi:O-antigen/teichoic acid export membrane protein